MSFLSSTQNMTPHWTITHPPPRQKHPSPRDRPPDFFFKIEGKLRWPRKCQVGLRVSGLGERRAANAPTVPAMSSGRGTWSLPQ